MKAYESIKIGQNRGSPRLWLEGMKAVMAGFLPGKRFAVRKDVDRKMLILELNDQGSRLVSRKIKGEKEVPVIDINSMEVLSIFEGFDTVRVIVQKVRIVILPATAELAKKERIERLRSKLANGDPILMGSLSHGGGVLSHAMHKGLSEAGVNVKLAFANEIRAELLEQAHEHNDAWDEDTIPLAAPLQSLAFDEWAMNQLPTVELVEAGLPCSGASVAGRAKRGLEHPEAHPEVGHLVLGFLAVIAKVQPLVVVLENVKPYMSSASMWLLRNQLHDFGYVVHEEVLQAADWNELEHRERMCMVALSEGVDFDFAGLQRPVKQDRRIAEILDPVADDDPSWGRMEGLKAKEARDKAAGKGFAMQIVTAFDTKCPTVTKGYSKVRSTDPKLQHPSDPGLLRQFTPMEHARIKGIPGQLVKGLPLTLAHELLGQSICYEPFKAVAKLIGRALNTVKVVPTTHEPELLQLVG